MKQANAKAKRKISDKQRLDWLEKNKNSCDLGFIANNKSVRKQIDAAIKWEENYERSE